MAKKENDHLTVWGDGSSRREFVYSKDIAKICFELLCNFEKLPLRLIVSGEKEYSIKEIAEIISEISGLNSVKFDTSKPNGQKKRPSDHSLFRSLFPDFEFSDINESLKDSYKWLENNYEIARK
jgi:GDP-L-fucose synthase